MITNLERYKDDLDRLIEKGNMLYNAIGLECLPDEFEKKYKKALGDKYTDYKEKLPYFRTDYQSWYSEALICIKQLLPDRLKDFTELYKSAAKRKDINYENYTIFDYLQASAIKLDGQIFLYTEAAIPKFGQQVRILESVKKRFESSLFEIRKLVQADLFDSELDSARELNKKGFVRGAGAVAGVVLERHLAQVCENHNLAIKKKDPSINDFNQLLKDNDVIDIQTWRFIQRLGDLRNSCDHNKDREPEKEKIEELIDGVDKITKTLF